VPTKSAAKKPAFTDSEKAAMRSRLQELKASEDREAGERDLTAKLADMPEPDRAMGQRFHELMSKNFPEMAPKTYYGMPAYAKDGKTIVWFKAASKFKVRYATVEFGVDAKLDDGDMWAVSFAVNKLTPAIEKRLMDLVKQAVS
jgi:uncharacterized protein YdhG (YjbR/CyaY superfamily)